jgi:hypothetical protein
MRAPIVACAAILFSGCATPGGPKKYFLEDSNARYYKAEAGEVLRVESDGTVLDVACLPVEYSLDTPRQSLPGGLCAQGKVRELGKVRKVADDWDMSDFAVEPETGRCRPLLRRLFKDFHTDTDEWEGLEANKRRSCWHRVWEVPTALVAYPTAVVVLVGLVTAPIWVPLLLLL